MTINLKMTSDRSAMTTEGEPIPSGTTVDYLYPRGAVIVVRLTDGRKVVVDPRVFPELR